MPDATDAPGPDPGNLSEGTGEALEFVYLADLEEALPRVARWYFDQWGHLRQPNSLEATERGLREYLNRGEIPFVLLALRNGEVVGAAQLKFREMAPQFMEREHWLGGVYVAADHRGAGRGAQLVERVAALARGLGVQTLSLQTPHLDGGLYARLGWKPVTRANNHGLAVLVMERQL